MVAKQVDSNGKEKSLIQYTVKTMQKHLHGIHTEKWSKFNILYTLTNLCFYSLAQAGNSTSAFIVLSNATTICQYCLYFRLVCFCINASMQILHLRQSRQDMRLTLIQICGESAFLQRNKTEHAVQSYAAGRDYLMVSNTSAKQFSAMLMLSNSNAKQC